MKKVLTLVSSLSCAFIIAACGYGGEGVLDGGADGRDGNGGGDQQQNECERAAIVQLQGFDEGCAGRSHVCCFCQCWNDGHKTFDTDQYFQNQTCLCVDPPAPQPQPCEGEALTDALACLANEIACQEQFKDLVLNQESGLCTLTPT